MKKIIVLLLLLGFIASCAPRRLGCGPGRRCMVEMPKDNTVFNQNVA
ncbi:hypothetical protein [Flavobacterium sp.]